MMRLPVSRLAFDVVSSERDWLRQKVDTLTDQLVRIERVREGLPELAKERKPPVLIPSDLLQHIAQSWSQPHNVHAEERRALRLYAESKDWDAVRAEMMGVRAGEVEWHGNADVTNGTPMHP